MKAVINTGYGSPDSLEIRDVPKPQPASNEVLIKVYATTVSRTDCGVLRAQPPLIGRILMGLFRPKWSVLGLDFAGVVEAIGTKVTRFKPGEPVFGMSAEHYGAHAQYLCVPEQGAIATMPIGKCFAEVVVGEGAWYAHTYLEKFDLKPGHKILIYGASGAIGIAAVQLSKARGAEVTAVVSTGHLDLAQSLGADQVVDYSVDDFNKIGKTFDFVFDAVGKTTFFQCRKLLKPTGIYSASDLGPWCQNLLLAAWFSFTKGNRVVMPMPKDSELFMTYLKNCIEAAQFQAVIDRKYAFAEIADAYHYVETAKKTGIVVINVSTKEKENASSTPPVSDTA